MLNMKPSRKGYRYRTGTVGPVVDVSVYYDKGGANYFQGTQERRGVYVSITPLTLETRNYQDGTPYTVESFTMFGGIKALAKELNRISPKALAEVAETIDSLAPQAAAAFSEHTKREAIRILIEPFKRVA